MCFIEIPNCFFFRLLNILPTAVSVYSIRPLDKFLSNNKKHDDASTHPMKRFTYTTNVTNCLKTWWTCRSGSTA